MSAQAAGDTHQIKVPPKLIPVFTAKNKRVRGSKGGRGSGKTRTFANLKAQCGFMLADDINEGAIYAKGVKDEADRELLSEELAHIKKVDTGDAPLKLKPKTEVKVDLGRSPDFSDLFLMKKMYDIKLSRMVAKPRDLN